MSIVYVDNPPFIVDFSRFANNKKIEKETLAQRVPCAVSRPFELVKFTAIAVAQSAHLNLSYSWTSFKHIVLGYYGSLKDYRPPEDIYFIAFKVAFWALAVSYCFATTTIRLLYEQINPPNKENPYLAKLAGGEINVEHLQTKESAIDVSGVPNDVTVDSLMDMFNAINFTDPNLPGYMTESSRREVGKTYSVEELRTGLQQFIANVKGRNALVGTPPGYDIPRLMTFYQQIEDALRFSIHKVNHALEQFYAAHGRDASTYSDDETRAYKDLLENKARVVIDMAIAGYHCGARYMGEAMTTYLHCKGEIQEEGTLKDSLFALLENKRNEIAQAQVQMHMGNDTHALSAYMGNLGQLLGLPGTRNVIEHLTSSSFDRNFYLKCFFEAYTVDAIIDAVQEQVKKSNFLREKITDWLRDQVGRTPAKSHKNLNLTTMHAA